jgi:hypothetical protein
MREYFSMKYEAEVPCAAVVNSMEVASLLRKAQLEIRRDRSAVIELISDAIGRLCGPEELELAPSPSPAAERPPNARGWPRGRSELHGGT